MVYGENERRTQETPIFSISKLKTKMKHSHSGIDGEEKNQPQTASINIDPNIEWMRQQNKHKNNKNNWKTVQ